MCVASDVFSISAALRPAVSWNAAPCLRSEHAANGVKRCCLNWSNAQSLFDVKDCAIWLARAARVQVCPLVALYSMCTLASSAVYVFRCQGEDSLVYVFHGFPVGSFAMLLDTVKCFVMNIVPSLNLVKKGVEHFFQLLECFPEVFHLTSKCRVVQYISRSGEVMEE